MRLLVWMLLVLLMGCGGDAAPTTVRVADPAGDIARSVNAKGQKPVEPLSSADLISVELEVSVTKLSVTFTLAAEIGIFPHKSDPRKGPGWFLRIYEEDSDDSVYFLGVLPAPSEQDRPGLTGFMRVFLCEGEQCSSDLRSAELSLRGRVLEMEIPLTQLPKLGKKFGWIATTFWNEGTTRDTAWGDVAPDYDDDGKEVRASYPAE